MISLTYWVEYSINVTFSFNRPKIETTKNDSDVRLVERWVPTENFHKFSPYCYFPRHSQIMVNTAIGVLFIEFPELHIHLDPFIDSVYISGSCRFRLYFFFCRDFAVPLMHPLFDLVAPISPSPCIWLIHFHLQQQQQQHQHHPHSRSPPFRSPRRQRIPYRLPAHPLCPRHPAATMPWKTPAWRMGSSLRSPFRGYL